MNRCNWYQIDSSLLLQEYHDHHWCIPIYDDYKLFELLSLEILSIGLSWLIILKKREQLNFHFDNFDYYKISKYTNDDIERLLQCKDIIRHKKKIESIINNAKAYINIISEFNSFSNYIWSFTNNMVVYRKDDNIVNKNDISDLISKDLKRRGFKFLGSIIIYSYLEAIGIFNNHISTCFKYNN